MDRVQDGNARLTLVPVRAAGGAKWIAPNASTVAGKALPGPTPTVSVRPHHTCGDMCTRTGDGHSVLLWGGHGRYR
jgi:hypothetical protein